MSVLPGAAVPESTPVLGKEVEILVFLLKKLTVSLIFVKEHRVILTGNHFLCSLQKNWFARLRQIQLHFQTHLLISLFTSLFSYCEHEHFKYLHDFLRLE